MNQIIKLANFNISNDLPMVLIAGPCQIESKSHAIEVADFLVNMSKKYDINLIYKSSFDKANRTSVHAKRGVGIDLGIEVFNEIKNKFNIPVITDIHTSEQCKIISEFIDIVQIPAFLCRQTDLLQAAAESGKIVNIKKGQFLSPYDMKNVVEKVKHFGNDQVMLTERGVSFGYNTLISDMRSLHIMAEEGTPVVFDATHSVQQPGSIGSASGGERKFVEILAKAAVAVGVAAIFIETHPDPDNAPSDGPCMIKLTDLPNLIEKLLKFDKLAKSN